MFRDRKGKMTVEYMIAIVILLILLFVVGYYVVYKKIGGTAGSAVPLCNNDIQKCACFYRSGSCPDVYMNRLTHSSMCPPDNTVCDSDEVYATALKQAQDDSRGSKGQNAFGTCCQAPASKVSPTRLRGWTAPTMTAAAKTAAKTPTETAPQTESPSRQLTIKVVTEGGWTTYNEAFFQYHRDAGLWKYTIDQNDFSSYHAVSEMEDDEGLTIRTFHPALKRISQMIANADEVGGYRWFARLLDDDTSLIEEIIVVGGTTRDLQQYSSAQS